MAEPFGFGLSQTLPMPIVARVMRANPSDSRMIDHVSLGVSDLSRSLAFYDAALAPLGVIRVWTSGDAAGYGYPGQDDAFAVKPRDAVSPRAGFALACRVCRSRPKCRRRVSCKGTRTGCAR